jgi:hypothetical protein
MASVKKKALYTTYMSKLVKLVHDVTLPIFLLAQKSKRSSLLSY